MPYASHYRLTLSGTIGAGVVPPEAFSFGVNLAKDFDASGNPTADGATQPDDDQMTNLVSDCTAFFSSTGAGIAAHAKLRQVKLAWIGTDGKYTRDPMIRDVSTAGGGVGGLVYPPQVSLAVSLNTARRGPTGKGRFYLPCPVYAVDSTSFQLTTAVADSTRSAVASFLNALQDEPGVDSLGLTVVVASSKGYNTPVTSVRVGRALDTVRSRRTSVAEQYGANTALSNA